MEEAAYKRLQLAWVSSNTGSTMDDIMYANLPLPLTIFFAGIGHRIFPRMNFFTGFTILLIPMLLNFTALSYASHLIPATLSICMSTYCLLCHSQPWSKLKTICLERPERFQPWITNFRASTHFITVFCILAVDLNVFPPKFAKTEIYGFGLMDLGVGIFVISHGFVHKSQPLRVEAKTILYLIALGAIRLISIKLIGYHEHVSEYGVHWNFFFTLALSRLLSTFISRTLQSTNYLLLAISTGIAHHTILSSGGQDWVLGSTPRDTLWDANREGITSIFGYVTLFYTSVAYMNYFKKLKLVGYHLLYTAFASMTLWVLTFYGAEYFGVSRRLCNIGYVVWTLAVSSSMSFIFILVDILLRWLQYPRMPVILQSINGRGLLFFLLGNVLTGLANLSVQTLLLSTWQSYSLIFSYMFLVTFLTHKLHKIR